jgi:hypothetical protein
MFRTSKMTSPELKWYEIQPSLGAWKGDILMILDCCYAFQAVRDHDSRIFELLAACGIRETTPQAGELSFTSAMIDTMETMLDETHTIVVADLYDRLLKLQSPLAGTPMRKLLKGDESVTFKPIESPRIGTVAVIPKPIAVLSLTISLSQKVDDNAMKRLARWMRTYVPKGVNAIIVDSILSKTEEIQSFLQKSPGSRLREEIAHELKSHSLPDCLTLQPTLETETPKNKRDEIELVRTNLQDIQNWNDRVYQSLQSNLLLNPDFSNDEAMYELMLSPHAKALGLADAARMSRLNLTLDDDSDLHTIKALPFDAIKPVIVPGLHHNGIHTYGMLGDAPVIIEKRMYSPNLPREKVLRNVKRLAKLLKGAHSSSFCIADFEGFVDEPLKNSFGLVFRVSLKTLDGPLHMTLRDLYRLTKKTPLNYRLGIATALARAISNMHAVGWLHKSLSSANILFFSDPDPERNLTKSFALQPSRPYLFGFFMSRPLAASSENNKEYRRKTQIYTHPRRWASPQETFYPMHDIYSLGVILLEIGLWKGASELDPTRQNFEDANDERQIQKDLIAVAQAELPHMMGKRYCNIVISCLSGSFEAMGEGKDASLLHKEFRYLVLESLVKMSTCL